MAAPVLGSTVRRLLLATLVVLAGCAAAPGDGHRATPPDDDRIGFEGGYWYDSDLDVTPGDGYNASERAAVVNRTMARVERIRDREFDRSVPVSVISRDEYRANRSGGAPNATHEAWNNQVWEALFLVAEDRNVSDSFDSTLGASVQGYYSPGDEEIVIVSDSPTPTVERGTLAHELVHALQDQHFDLGGSPDTQDRQLAESGAVEGEARYVEGRFQRRCESRWSCIPAPPSDGSSSPPADYNRGLFLAVYAPYAAGPAFVDRVRQRRGWTGVDALHDAVPDSTEQVIHPGRYPDEEPVDVTVADRSSDEWRRFDHDPVADTVGEASIYATVVANGVVNPDQRYSYESMPSAGWGGDAVVPYTDGESGAYVWKTVWDSRGDAREFVDAYRDVLSAHDAEEVESGVYVVPESDPFDDAFRVVRDGKTVRIVNAPTVEELDDVYASPSGA